MMQQAHAHRCWSLADGRREVKCEPYQMEACTVAWPNADLCIERLLRRLPINFENDAELTRTAACADFVWFVWTTDRDMNNALVLQ